MRKISGLAKNLLFSQGLISMDLIIIIIIIIAISNKMTANQQSRLKVLPTSTHCMIKYTEKAISVFLV
jgi:hypothetical protein